MSGTTVADGGKEFVWLQPIADLSDRLSPQPGEMGRRFADLERPAPSELQAPATAGAAKGLVAGAIAPVADGP